jgi:hypothetical protein
MRPMEPCSIAGREHNTHRRPWCHGRCATPPREPAPSLSLSSSDAVVLSLATTFGTVRSYLKTEAGTASLLATEHKETSRYSDGAVCAFASRTVVPSGCAGQGGSLSDGHVALQLDADRACEFCAQSSPTEHKYFETNDAPLPERLLAAPLSLPSRVFSGLTRFVAAFTHVAMPWRFVSLRLFTGLATPTNTMQMRRGRRGELYMHGCQAATGGDHKLATVRRLSFTAEM